MNLTPTQRQPYIWVSSTDWMTVYRHYASLTGPTHFRKRREVPGERIQLCPGALYNVVQSHYSILSHDALRHSLSSNSNLENGDRELGHLFHCCRSCQNTLTILLRERAYSATGNSRVNSLKSGYIIQLIVFQWDTACIHSSPDPSLLSRKWVRLTRLALCSVQLMASDSRPFWKRQS